MANLICGGAGTRLWPLSRDSLPKQFAPLLGGIAGHAEPDLAQVAHAANVFRLMASGAQRRKNDCDQNRDDPDDNQKFHQRKAALGAP